MLFTGEDDEIFDMGGVGEVASLGGGVARKIDGFLWGNFEEFVDEAFVAAGTRWIQNNCLTMLDIIKCFFRFCQNGKSSTISRFKVSKIIVSFTVFN